MLIDLQYCLQNKILQSLTYITFICLTVFIFISLSIYVYCVKLVPKMTSQSCDLWKISSLFCTIERDLVTHTLKWVVQRQAELVKIHTSVSCCLPQPQLAFHFILPYHTLLLNCPWSPTFSHCVPALDSSWISAFYSLTLSQKITFAYWPLQCHTTTQLTRLCLFPLLQEERVVTRKHKSTKRKKDGNSEGRSDTMYLTFKVNDNND